MKNVFFLLSFAFFTLTLSSCNDCKDVVCNNGGICEDGACECPNGFSGASCDVEDLCITQNVICLNDGVCVDGECDCEPFYRGENCQTYCEKGSFSSSNSTCNCWPGWEGDGCTVESRDAWIGTYSQSNTDCNPTATSTETISALDHPDPDSLTIAVNYVGITGLTTAGDTKAYGLIDGNTLTIPKQNVRDANNTLFSVESAEPATMSGNSFTVEIIRKFSGNATTCTITYVKQ